MTANAIDKTELGPHDLALTLACDICTLCYICSGSSVPEDNRAQLTMSNHKEKQDRLGGDLNI